VEVVPVARQPEVFVHALEPEQAQRLVKITRTTRDRVRLRRAGVVLASVQGRSATEIAMMFAATENYETSSTPSTSEGSRHWTQNGAAADQLSLVRSPVN
jgi:hypothetical protein